MPEDVPQIWPAYLNPYSMELKFQLVAAKSAFESLETHLEQRKELILAFQKARREEYVLPLQLEERAFFLRHTLPIANLTGAILGDVQGFLAAAGVVSSILWPSNARFHGETDAQIRERSERGAEIQRLLSVADDSILRLRTRKENDVRGAFLHFDEIIDDFNRSNPGESFVSFAIGSAAGETAIRRDEAARWLDEASLDLWANGRSSNLRTLWNELLRVLGRIRLESDVKVLQVRRTEGEPPIFGTAFGAKTD